MSRHRRGRITVQNQPTGAARGMMRLMGVFHAVMGLVFVAVSFEVIASTGLFGIPFLAGGAFFTVNGIRMAVSKNDIAHRVGYDIETDVEQETIVGLLEDVDKLAAHAPISSTTPIKHDSGDVKSRLQQLKDLKDAGLIDDMEYKQKRQEILKEL